MAMVAITCMVIFVPWNLLFALVSPLPDSIQEEMEDAIGFGLDGIIVYVDQDGQEPAFYTAGWKNRAEQIPADPASYFKIASISKLYVAAAIVKLEHQGSISLDQNLSEFFPHLKGRIEHAERITLKQMLQHRSGIPNLTDHPDFPWSDPPKNNQEGLAYALDLPAEFEPGSDYAYSNTNYLLLAELIDQVSGMPHFQYIKESILDSLGLTHTYATMRDVAPNEMMSGYYLGYEPAITDHDYGSMIATAEDVGIFLRALNEGSFWSEAEHALYASVYVFEHTGLLPGYQSFAKYYPDIDAVVIQFVNTSGGDMWSQAEISYNRIARILRKEAEATSSQ